MKSFSFESSNRLRVVVDHRSQPRSFRVYIEESEIWREQMRWMFGVLKPPLACQLTSMLSDSKCAEFEARFPGVLERALIGCERDEQSPLPDGFTRGWNVRPGPAARALRKQLEELCMRLSEARPEELRK